MQFGNLSSPPRGGKKNGFPGCCMAAVVVCHVISWMNGGYIICCSGGVLKSVIPTRWSSGRWLVLALIYFWKGYSTILLILLQNAEAPSVSIEIVNILSFFFFCLVVLLRMFLIATSMRWHKCHVIVSLCLIDRGISMFESMLLAEVTVVLGGLCVRCRSSVGCPSDQNVF